MSVINCVTVERLLRYYYQPEVPAPVTQADEGAQKQLERFNLIEPHEGRWTISSRGEVHVQDILNLPLPTMAWVPGSRKTNKDPIGSGESNG